MDFRKKVEIIDRAIRVKDEYGVSFDGVGVVIVDEDTPVCLCVNHDVAKDVMTALNFTSAVPDEIFYNATMEEIARLQGQLMNEFRSAMCALILEYEDAKAPDCEALQEAKRVISELAKSIKRGKELLGIE